MIAPPRFTFPILNPSTFSLFVLLATSKTQGAFISEHVEIRDIDEGLSGLVFASQSILKGESISTVPLNLTISAAQSEYFDDEDDYDKEMCHLLHNVHSSIIKNDTIQTPYYERYFTTKSNISVTLGSNPQIDHELNLNVMEWAKTQGAFISEHVEIRDIDEGLSGLFASQSILKGEIISTVPLNLTISAQSEYFDDEDDYDTEMCHLLHNVHSSIIKNDTIQTPYERYLTSRTHHHIPSNWSPQAKKMLKQLDSPATAPLFGFEFHDVKDRIQTCGGFDENMATDSKFADAASLTYTRSEGVEGIALVPFMDLINHANGKRLNIDANHVLGEKFEFIATRTIEKGEQLNCSYNRCSYCTCFEQGNGVTPHLFFEYGFVETLPQRWAFANVDLIFDIDGKEGHGDDELEVNFVKPPTKADVYFMNKELKRLSFVRRRYLKNSERKMAKISELELDSITKFHKALVDAFTHALKSAEAAKRRRNLGTMAG